MLPLVTPTLDRAAAPLDRLRRAVLLGLVRQPTLAPLLSRRDERVRLHALTCAAAAVALTMLCPGVLFVASPALFGVAHVAADARYLVLRRDLPRPWTVALVAGCVALFALRVLEGALPARWPFAALEVGIGWAWIFTGLAAGYAATRTTAAACRASLLAPLVAAAGWAALRDPPLARLVFAHIHNLVALGLWVYLFRARRRFALPAIALLAAATALLLTGAALPWVHLAGPAASRLVDEALFAWPAWMPQRTAIELGLVFVMLQAVHYSVLLALIPQDDARAQGTLSFRMSLRSLTRDFPAPLLALVVLVAVAILGASFVDVTRTRQLYLWLAGFHGYLELAAAAFLIVRGKSAMRSTHDEVTGE
jgi:hypothetical protein